MNIGTEASPVYAIKAKFGLYTDQFLSAKGVNSMTGDEGSGSGLNETLLWQILANSGTEQIAANHLTSALSGYLQATATDKTNWNTAYTNNHTHSNKTVLDGITSALVTN